MKRNMISLILVLALCFSLALGVSASYGVGVWDEADLLTDTEEAQLSEKLVEIGNLYDAEIVIMTLESSGGWDIDELVNSVYDTMEFGYGENRDGILLLICMDIREYRILSNGFAGTAITGSDINYIGDAMVPDLSAGNYATAFDIFADECVYYLDGYINGYPFDFGATLVMCLIFGLVVGLIVAFVLKGQLKSVRRQNAAQVYIKPGSMQVTLQRDLFLYRNVTRTKKANTNSSGSRSGGSSRSVGGGRF